MRQFQPEVPLQQHNILALPSRAASKKDSDLWTIIENTLGYVKSSSLSGLPCMLF